MNAETLTFEELARIESGTMLAETSLGLLKGLIVRGPGALCAYIGVPSWYPLNHLHYDNIDLDVHGGLTFSGGGDDVRPKGYYWFGWDYAHWDDATFYKYDPRLAGAFSSSENEWTAKEVAADLEDAMYAFMPIFIYGWIEIRFRLFLRWLSQFSPARAIRIQATILEYKLKSLWLNLTK